jgi:hypothetical protein
MNAYSLDLDTYLQRKPPRLQGGFSNSFESLKLNSLHKNID